MSTLRYLLFFLMISVRLSAQEAIGGLVFDKDSKLRINRVSITNLRTKETLYNNTKGEFFIQVKKGDLLIAAKEGYQTDTLKIGEQSSLVIYLQRLAIPLPEVVFKDSLKLARAKYEEAKKAFNQAVTRGNQDILNIANGSVGLGIDGIWSAFSKEGKNARRLMEIMERDYKNNLIDQQFNKDLVSRVTGLKGDALLIFMINYRPSYNFVAQANEYVLISYIKHAYMRYKANPNMPDINSFKPIMIDP